MILAYLPFLLFASLFAQAAPAPYKPYYPWKPVSWTIAPKSIKADTTVTLSWKGGSGNGYVSDFAT
jgi:hypothetical protein